MNKKYIGTTSETNPEERTNFLNLSDTHTTKHGTTSFIATGDDTIDSALELAADGISFAYYAILDNGYAGHTTRESALNDAIGYLEDAAETLKLDTKGN